MPTAMPARLAPKTGSSAEEGRSPDRATGPIAWPWLVLALLLLLAPAREARADTVRLSGRIRDFSDSHPDFEAYLGSETGIVEPRLGADGKPVYDGSRSHRTVTSRASFDQWYRDRPGVNEGMDLLLELDSSLTPDPRVFSFDDQTFFPIDGQLLGNEGRSHNYHFTLELHSRFTYQPGQFFRFRGDDDLWVFIDERLVIDLGGVHGALEGSVDLDTLGLEPGRDYRFDLFFAERHTADSHFRIDTSLLLLPTPTPSPTDTPSPTATPTPSSTPSPTPSPSPTASPTPAPRYLPLALRESCPERWRPIDALLVIDASTSMRATTARGRSKLAAAAAAAAAFIDRMALGPQRDRAGLLQFNALGRSLVGLTDDRGALAAALSALDSRPGSRVDLGLAGAWQSFRDAGPGAGRRRIVILLSDGLVNGASPAEVLLQADRLRDAEVSLWTVGLGSEIDRELLRALAGDPERYLEAPEAEALAAIYADLAERLTCPRDAFWARR